MKKYSEIAPEVRSAITKVTVDANRTVSVKDIENILSKHNVSSISELPLNVKAQLLNGK